MSNDPVSLVTSGPGVNELCHVCQEIFHMYATRDGEVFFRRDQYQAFTREHAECYTKKGMTPPLPVTQPAINKTLKNIKC